MHADLPGGRIALTLSALFLVALAGCLGADLGRGETPPVDEEGRYVIAMTESNRFAPGHAIVPKGAVVVWVGEGGTHDVTAVNGSWSSDDEGDKLESGDRFVRTFDVPGIHEYRCEVHRLVGMSGVVEVPTGNASAMDSR